MEPDATPRHGWGWFAYFRFYGPTEPFFNKSWALPDIEKMK